MSKRQRTDGGFSRPQQRARMASMAIARKYPYADYGRIMHRRGTPAGIARFGETYRSASQTQRANRRAAGYYGRGEYYGKKAGRWLAERSGIPGAGAVGEWVGDKAGDYIKKNWIPSWLGGGLYEGRGDYLEGCGNKSTNSLISGSARTPPRFGSVQDETGALIVSHREYIGDIFGPDSASRSFKNRVYDLNPGIEATFPWLSQIAQNYEEYEFGQLVFEFKSTVNPSVSGDGQMGTIVQVTNYNSGSRPFDDKNQMMQYDGSQSCRSTQHACHGVECDPNKYSGAKGHYIRTGPMPDEDIKSYDHGKYQLATVGMPDNFDNDPIGELWVYYTVKLRKPRLFSGKSLNVSRDVYCMNQTPGGSEAHLSTAVWAKHASSSLGTKVEFVSAKNYDATSTQADAGLWKMTFPASYSGNIEVVLNCCGDFHADWNIASSSSAPSADMTAFMTLGFNASGSSADATIAKTGNVELISDMFGSYPGQVGVVGVDDNQLMKPRGLQFCGGGLTGTTGQTGDTLITRVHLKIGVATHGVDNTISFNLPRVSNAAGKILQCVIEAAEYNTFNADPKGVAEGAFVNQTTKVAVDPKSLSGF